MPVKTHYQAKGKPICGVRSQKLTSDPSKVDCKRCRKSMNKPDKYVIEHTFDDDPMC